MATKVTEASLSCSICLRRFRKPRILPCLHSYCEDCLVEYALRGTERIACPLCGVKVDIPDGDVTKFKLDFRLQSQVEEANRYDKESGITAEVLACSCCQDEAEAMAKCSDCDQMLCKFGMKAHENLSVLQLHTVTLLNGDEINQVEQIREPKTRTPADKTPQKYPIEKRAILVSNLPRLEYSPGRIRDRLTMHFQKRSSNGGDVEGVVYPIHGCPQNAVVVFTERQAYTSVLRCEHYLEDFQTKVSTKPLLQVFKEFEASVNDFYWNLVPRLEMKSFIDTLSKRFGKDNLKVSGHVITKVVCTVDQLEEVHEAIIKATGLKHSSGTEQSAISSGIFVKDIPYLTNDVEQLRNELKKHFESEGVSQVESLLCPIQGNTKEAIVLFRSNQEREDYIKHSDKCFFGVSLRIIKLPPIFREEKAYLEDFHATRIKHYGLNATRAKIHSSCSDPDMSTLSVSETELKGTSEQITAAASVILEMIDVPLDSLIKGQFDMQGVFTVGTQTRKEASKMATQATQELKSGSEIDAQVVQGDIGTMQDVDAINPTDENMRKHVGAEMNATRSRYATDPNYPTLASNTGSGATQHPTTVKSRTSAANRNTSLKSSVEDFGLSRGQIVTNNTFQVCGSKCWSQIGIKRLEGCGHSFCTNCFTRLIVPNCRCLTCSSPYYLIHENTLNGTMTYYIREDINLPGQCNTGAFVINYKFPYGVAVGNTFTAYLPNDAAGFKTAWLLSRAFVAGLSFRVTTHGAPEVTWSESIPHKINIQGGIANHGYPDPGYIARVNDSLRKLGIVSNVVYNNN